MADVLAVTGKLTATVSDSITVDGGRLEAQGFIPPGSGTGGYQITGNGSRVESETGIVVGTNGIDVPGTSVNVAPYLDFDTTSYAGVFYLDPAPEYGSSVAFSAICLKETPASPRGTSSRDRTAPSILAMR